MNPDVRTSLAWAAVLIGVALLATLARHAGWLEPETVTRVVVGLNGLMVAWWGNRMPKSFVPSELARRVTRVGGWSMVLSGLVYAGVWVFAPVPVAVAVGCGAIVLGIAVTVVYCLMLRSRPTAA